MFAHSLTEPHLCLRNLTKHCHCNCKKHNSSQEWKADPIKFVLEHCSQSQSGEHDEVSTGSGISQNWVCHLNHKCTSCTFPFQVCSNTCCTTGGSSMFCIQCFIFTWHILTFEAFWYISGHRGRSTPNDSAK